MLTLLLSLAHAASPELAVEFATLPVTDEAQDRFGSGSTLPALGGRAGLALTDALTVQLAAHHGERGATWGDLNDGSAAAAFFATDASLALEAVAPVNDYFAVGGLAEGTALLGVARFDGATDDRDNEVYGATGFAPGFRAAAAVRLSVPESALPMPLQFRVTGGYQWFAPMKLGDFGSTQLRGFSLRVAAGVQF